MHEPIKIGISSCLLGNKVRYDGGHKLDRYIRDTLGIYLKFVPVCPEVECGLPIPRETLRLVGEIDSPRLLTTKTGIDYTEQMQTWSRRRLAELEHEDLCGFIFKKDSPSSGLYRVKVYSDKGMPEKKGTGMFARAFTQHFPRIPVEEEGRLHDPKLRENFVEQIFTFQRWRDVLAQRKTMGRLVDYHTRHKLLLMAHSPKHYRYMGKLVASGIKLSPAQLFDTYEQQLMEAMRLQATVKKHCNVLLHLMGYFKKNLNTDEKQELLELIAQYRQGHLPLIVPVTLINHFVRKYRQPYLALQYYLNPHPTALKLRNHA